MEGVSSDTGWVEGVSSDTGWRVCLMTLGGGCV